MQDAHLHEDRRCLEGFLKGHHRLEEEDEVQFHEGIETDHPSAELNYDGWLSTGES